MGRVKRSEMESKEKTARQIKKKTKIKSEEENEREKRKSVQEKLR